MDGLFHGKSHLEVDADWGYLYFRKPPYTARVLSESNQLGPSEGHHVTLRQGRHRGGLVMAVFSVLPSKIPWKTWSFTWTMPGENDRTYYSMLLFLLPSLIRLIPFGCSSDAVENPTKIDDS